MLLIHNMTRHVRTRGHRQAAPVHHRRTLRILDTQRRLVLGRPLAISEEDVQRNLQHLRDLEASGHIEIRSVEGARLRLDTLEFEAPPTMPPVPNVLLDSANNDPPKGKELHAIDNSEPLPTDPSGFAGGGLTPEALEVAKQRADTREELTEEERQLLEAEDQENTPDPQTEGEMADAFADTAPAAEETEIEHTEVTSGTTKKSKKNRNR